MIMKINKIDLRIMRNDAHFQFFSDFRDTVTKIGAAALKIKPHFDDWLAFFEKEDEALKKINKSALTQQIQDADKLRDDTFIGMVEITGAYLRHCDKDISEAARRLKIVFDTYGNIAKKPIKEQTAATVNILQELQGKYAADCATVRISDWVSLLATQNEALNKLVSDRIDETVAKTDVVLREARIACDEAYRKICDIVNVYILLEGVSNYEVFVKTLNAIIAKYGVRHHRRLNPDSPDLEDSPDSNTGSQNGGTI
jgi:hypothetical protein